MTTTSFPARFILAADILLTAPMHISAIEKGRYVYAGENTKRLRYDSRDQGIQLALTRTMRLANHVDVISNEGDETRRYGLDIPVIPASTLGGALRNSAATLICKSLIQRDLTLSTNAFNMLHTGSATTSLDADKTSPEVVRAARLDPFMANFGGSSFALSSRSVVATGLPLIEKTREMLMSPPLDEEGVLSMERLYDMTSVMAIVRTDPLRSLSNETIQDVISEAALNAYFDDLTEKDQKKATNKALAKADPGSATREKKTDTRTLNAMEVINPGMSFALRIQVDALTQEQLGLMVLAFQKVLRDSEIGGKTARGFGQFICKDSRLLQIDPSTNRPFPSSESRLFQDRSTGYAVAGLDNESPTALVSAVQSAQDFLSELDPSLIEAFANTNADAIKQLAKEPA
jgi:CRISPR type IV-associated protein Csf2